MNNHWPWIEFMKVGNYASSTLSLACRYHTFPAHTGGVGHWARLFILHHVYGTCYYTCTLLWTELLGDLTTPVYGHVHVYMGYAYPLWEYSLYSCDATLESNIIYIVWHLSLWPPALPPLTQTTVSGADAEQYLESILVADIKDLALGKGTCRHIIQYMCFYQNFNFWLNSKIKGD